MPKTIKEVYTDYAGHTTVEYSDDTTRKYSVDDVPTVQTNPLTGGNDIQAGTSTLKLPAGEVDLTGGVGGGAGAISIASTGKKAWRPIGSGGSTFQADRTYGLCFAVVGGFLGVQIAVSNIDSTASRTFRAKVGASPILAQGGTTLPLSWLTFGGATSIVVAPAQVVDGQTIPTVVLSDPIAVTPVPVTDGLSVDPYLYVRLHSPEMLHYFNVAMSAGLMPTSGIKMTSGNVAGDQVTNTSATATGTSSANFTFPVSHFVIHQGGKTVSMHLLGDSLSASTVAGASFPIAALKVFADLGKPNLSISNWGVGGRTRFATSAEIRQFVTSNKPDVVIMWDYSVNSPMGTAAERDAQFGLLLGDIQACRNAGVKPVVITMHPGGTPNTDRSAYNDRTRALCADNILVLDLAKVLAVDPNNPTALNPIYWVSGGDSTHINQLAYETFAEYACPLLVKYIA